MLGDLDGDGVVGFSDFLALASNFGADVENYADGDVNCDGTVAFDDFLALAENFGKTITAATSNLQLAAVVPEPSTSILALVVLSALPAIFGCRGR